MNKILCFLAALIVLLTAFSLAEDAGSWNFDTVDYSLDGYNGAGGDVIIPDVIQDCTVDIIGLNAFNAVGGITSLALPGTVRQIEDGAISFCNDLASLVLNEGLVVIGDNCFVCNPALEEITIPASVSYIGNGCFDSCSGLRKVTFTGACPVFAGVAFDWIADDAVIYVPDDQLEAYAAAFAGMELDLNLQGSGAQAQLCDFTCDPAQLGFDVDTGTILYYDGYDVRVDIPAEIDGVQVRAIDEEAFLNRQYLCYLTIPEGVEVIGDSAFESCVRLLHIDFPSTLRQIGDRAFASGFQGRSLNLPENLEAIGSEAFYWAVRLSGALDLPQGLRSIGDGAFSGCSWLEEVYIPDSVEEIGENAFADCGMNYVVFEGLQLPRMPETVFANCSYLADIDLNCAASKQQMLDMQAAVDALGLNCRVWRMQNPDVDYIYDGLDIYERGVLTGYTGTQSHLRPWDSYDDFTVTAVGEGAFRDNKFIEYFAVPYNDEFTTIGAEAFANSTLKQVDLFDSVTTIEADAFRGCDGLTELTIPESVTFVGEGALDGCTALGKLVVLCDPFILPDDLLADCPDHMEVYASESANDEQLAQLSMLAGRAFYAPVTCLGEALPELQIMPYEPLSGEDFWYEGEFARLDNYLGYELNLILPRQIDGVQLSMVGSSVMTRASFGDNYEVELPAVSLVIPETYAEIPHYALQNCETLETVICYAPLETLGDCTFKNCTALREVIFVNGVHSIGEYVFDNCPNLECVYVGPYVQQTGEFAFLNEDGSQSFDAEACLITDPQLMPDVDALLQAVQREPMPAPEPTPAPVAQPVGEEGAPFLGIWHGTEMIMGDTVYSFSDFDMTMTILFSEDGRMVISEGETIDMSLVGDGDWQPWHVEGGAAVADQSVMTIQADGRLCVEEEGMQMLFEREAQAAALAAPAVEAAGEAASMTDDRCGIKYVCVNADVDGYTLDASMLGGEYSIVFHEDGTLALVLVGAAIPGAEWSQGDDGNFLVDYYGTILEIAWTQDGFDMNYFDTMLMHFIPEGK